jgi:hypothetical protein
MQVHDSNPPLLIYDFQLNAKNPFFMITVCLEAAMFQIGIPVIEKEPHSWPIDNFQ